MKSDELEKFVSQNRDDFDDFTPDPAIWAQVQKNIEPKKTISIKRIMYRAAAVLVIFISSYVFHDYRSEKKQSALLMEQADEEQIQEARNFFETKAYYTSMIGNKQKEVFSLTKDYPELTKELRTEFKEVDQQLSDLQKDLKDGASNEEIIEAMIQNYRLKLAILEDVLLELSSENTNEKPLEHEI